MTSGLQVAVRAYTYSLGETEERASPPRDLLDSLRYPEWILVLDTETTIDPSQRLLFDSYRVIDVSWDAATPSLSCVEEGLIFDDNVTAWNPKGYRVLDKYVRTHGAAVDPLTRDPQPNLLLRPRAEFADEVWWPYVYEAQAQVVCFNWPFDVSRLAVHTGTAGPRRRRRRNGVLEGKPKRSVFEGGWSLSLWGRFGPDGKWHDHPAKHRVLIKQVDSKRALKGFGGVAGDYIDPADLVWEDEEASSFRGHALDLRTLTFAVTDKGHTLESSCDAFGVPYTKRDVTHGEITPEYVDYNREDVQATAKLLAAAMAEYVRHPTELQATKAYSPASIGKAYLRAMGVRPALERLGAVPEGLTWDEVLGFSMVAYFGGRAECRIRRAEVPVVIVDFTSMYPTVQTLMGLERLLTCERIDAVEEAPEATERWVRRAVRRVFDKKTWQRLNVICLVEPAPGDVLPIRARYQGRNSLFGIGLNEWAEIPAEALWYTLPDVLASCLLSGQVPRILRAIRLVPWGWAEELRPVKIRGEVEADLRSGRFFASIIERRAKLPKDEQKTGLGLFLKVLANSTSYGIFAEMRRRELSGRRTERLSIHGLRFFERKIQTPESPGEFFFAPTAALVTGAARLMLAMLEREVNDRGGTYAFCDTDSMAIVPLPRGRWIDLQGVGADGSMHPQRMRALSWKDVREVVAAFDELNPYDNRLVKHLLKVEDENFEPPNGRRRQRELLCYAISAKRYCLFLPDPIGRPRIVAVSDAGELDEEGEEARQEAEVVKRSEHGLGHLLNPLDPDSEDRDWIRAAWEWLVAIDTGHPVPELPWLNLPAVSRTSVSTPGGMRAFELFNRSKRYSEAVKPFNFLLTCYPSEMRDDGSKARLVAPYERDASRWVRLDWYDTHTGKRRRITTYGRGSADAVRVRTYQEILESYVVHDESKSLGPDGTSCARATRGLLDRFAVRVDGRVVHLGKESNRLEERMREEVEVEDNFLNVFEERLCACGCGRSVTARQRYFASHRQRAYRERRRARAADRLAMKLPTTIPSGDLNESRSSGPAASGANRGE